MKKIVHYLIHKLSSSENLIARNCVSILKISGFVFILNTDLIAQCTTGSQTGTVNPMIAWQTENIPGGIPNYYSFTAQAGVSYTFTYCDGGGSTTGDSYLTISDNTPTFQIFNDDYCGLSSNLFWTCTVGGTYRIYVSGCCPCSNTPSGVLAYRATQNNVPCAGQPGANSVPSPNYSVCPGAVVALGLANTYTVNGISYQWQSSTLSGLGPWTSISGATLTTYTSTPINATTYYSAIITCANAPTQTLTSGAATVLIAGPSTSVVPYNESFEGVGATNLLPNCSWSASGLGGSCQTYTAATTANRSARTGSKFAAFNSSGGDFYSNGIYLDAGVTYSAALFYKTEAVNNYQNWLNMSIKVGPNQSQVSSTVVASTSGAAASGAYKLLNGTFTVASSGLYYVDVKATYTGGGAPYLIWDDLSITIPCQLNTPALSINSTFTNICAGQSVLLSVAGGTSYTWSNGSTGNSINVTPLQTTNYVATGVGVSGCSGSISQMIIVRPTPDMSIFSPVSSICEGSSVNLTAVGAGSGATYMWSNNATTQVVTVSPLATTSYSVYATNSFGCSGIASNIVTVNPKPNVGATASSIKICKGETVVLNGTGATNYSWASNSYFNQGTSVNVTPNASVVYTVTGTTNNCSNVAFVSVEVLACTGINSLSSNNSFVKVYPNPNNGDFTIELNNGLTNSIKLVDLTGRVVLSTSTSDSKINLNINSLSNGVYFLKIKSDNAIQTVKVIKN